MKPTWKGWRNSQLLAKGENIDYRLGANCNKGPAVCQRTFPTIAGGSVDLSVLKQSGVQVIRLRGRLTLGPAVESFREALDQAFNAGDHRILLNLAEVPMMDSSGIGLLIRSQTIAKQQGGSLKLVQPTDYTVKTLKMVGLLSLFEVYDSEEEAVASFDT